MIASDRDVAGVGQDRGGDPAVLPEGLPGRAANGRRALPCGERLDLLAVPIDDTATGQAPLDSVAEIVRHWVDAAAPADQRPGTVVVPLYGCLVAWAPGRAAAVGPAERIGQLETALVEFADLEARLRDIERRAAVLLDHVEADAALGIGSFDQPDTVRRDVARRYREAVAVGRHLALLAPGILAPPVHPPSLGSQLGERLRERTRLAERHAQTEDRADLIERVTEACAQRLVDAGIAQRQTALEWAIVVLLVVQTALVLVDLLAAGAAL